MAGNREMATATRPAVASSRSRGTSTYRHCAASSTSFASVHAPHSGDGPAVETVVGVGVGVSVALATSDAPLTAHSAPVVTTASLVILRMSDLRQRSYAAGRRGRRRNGAYPDKPIQGSAP